LAQALPCGGRSAASTHFLFLFFEAMPAGASLDRGTLANPAKPPISKEMHTAMLWGNSYDPSKSYAKPPGFGAQSQDVAPIPGYGGFLPGKYAEAAYEMRGGAGTFGAINARLAQIHTDRRKLNAGATPFPRSDSLPNVGCDTPSARSAASGTSVRELSNAMRRSASDANMSTILQNYSVPHIPGYQGYVPGGFFANPENIHGGTYAHNVKASERLHDIRRRPVPEWHGTAEFEATQLRKLGSVVLPGYTGHIPSEHGEAVFGGTTRDVAQRAVEAALTRREERGTQSRRQFDLTRSCHDWAEHYTPEAGALQRNPEQDVDLRVAHVHPATMRVPAKGVGAEPSPYLRASGH